MKVISTITISITALIHILFFKLESLDFMKPEVLQKFGLDQSSGQFVKVWAFNQGFYNLFFAIGLFYSLFLINFKDQNEGRVLASFILISIVGAGVVLYASQPQKLSAALIQAIPALIAVISLKCMKTNNV